jgi:hypothetical protein
LLRPQPNRSHRGRSKQRPYKTISLGINFWRELRNKI